MTTLIGRTLYSGSILRLLGVATQGLSDDSLMGGTFHSVSLGAYNPTIQDVKLQDQDPGELLVTPASLEPSLLRFNTRI